MISIMALNSFWLCNVAGLGLTWLDSARIVRNTIEQLGQSHWFLIWTIKKNSDSIINLLQKTQKMISENRTSSKELSNQLENKMWKWGLRSFESCFFSLSFFLVFVLISKRWNNKKMFASLRYRKCVCAKNAFKVWWGFFGLHLPIYLFSFLLKINHLAALNVCFKVKIDKYAMEMLSIVPAFCGILSDSL